METVADLLETNSPETVSSLLGSEKAETVESLLAPEASAPSPDLSQRFEIPFSPQEVMARQLIGNPARTSEELSGRNALIEQQYPQETPQLVASMNAVPWYQSDWNQFRGSRIGHTIFGPTPAEQQAIQEGVMAGPPGNEPGFVPTVLSSPVTPIGLGEMALAAKFPEMAKGVSTAGKALMGAFIARYAVSQPDRVADVMDKFHQGKTDEAWHDVLGDALDTTFAAFGMHALGASGATAELALRDSPGSPDADAKLRAEILKARQEGPSPEFRSLFGGIDPEVAGTTPGKVAAYAQSIGRTYVAPEKAAPDKFGGKPVEAAQPKTPPPSQPTVEQTQPGQKSNVKVTPETNETSETAKTGLPDEVELAVAEAEKRAEAGDHQGAENALTHAWNNLYERSGAANPSPAHEARITAWFDELNRRQEAIRQQKGGEENAPGEIEQQAGVQPEREGGNARGETAEAGGGNRVQHPAESAGQPLPAPENAPSGGEQPIPVEEQAMFGSLPVGVSKAQWDDMHTLNREQQLAKYGTTTTDLIEKAVMSKEAAPMPLKEAVRMLADEIQRGPLTKKRAEDILHPVYGGTIAQGKFTTKDMTDAIEMAVNHIVANHRLPDAPMNAIAKMRQLMERLPTQTTRTAEMDKFQQFSTPPTLAYVANWMANLKRGETVLEPSAGIGGLAAFAKSAGANVVANELSDRRAEMLRQTEIPSVITKHNAEHLNALLTPDIVSGKIPQPTAVVMNPPFSNAAKSGEKNTLVGAKHVEEALKLLPKGGRLVAIVGQGMAHDKAMFKPWWKQIQKEYNVRANIGVSGKEYTKYGTSFGNQLLVIDKTGPTPEGGVVTGNVDKVEELIPKLSKIRYDRPAIEPASTQPSGAVAPGPTAGAVAAGPAAPVEPRARGASEGRGAGGRVQPGGQGAAGLEPGAGVAGAGIAESGRGAGAGRGEEPAVTGSGGAGGGGTQGRVEGVTVGQKEAGNRELNEHGVFSEYVPQKVQIAGSKAHPTPLVEPTAMAAVEPVDPKHSPKLAPELISKGAISDAQLENVVYAGQAHEVTLPSGERMGYFIGDGTGVGKGRQIAAIILDNWNQGRRKAVWVSAKQGLMRDAGRDLGDLGFDTEKLIDFKKEGGKRIVGAKEGVAFVPYSSLTSKNPGLEPTSTAPGQTPKIAPLAQGAKASRMHLLSDWLGKDFDGVIVFDEAHLAGNAIDIKGNRGVKPASARGRTVLDVQRLFPKARVVYASATGATDVTNLSYADRLGIWGPGTPFPSKQAFFDRVASGGLSAMEIVARDLKSMGRYLARTLSFEGVSYRQLLHKLTPEQLGLYDEVARSWQYVLQHRDETMAKTGAANSAAARSAANSAFYGAQQRFYNQLLTAMQMPSVLADAKGELAKGNSLLFQVVNTNEATLDREIAEKAGSKSEEDKEGNYLEDLDLSPRDIVLQYIDSSYPTTLWEPVEDENGNVKYVEVKDAKGNPVSDPQALQRKQELMDRIALMKAPSNPLEMLLDTFGAENVAEVTGRSRRVVNKMQADGTMKRVLEVNRGEAQRKSEAQEFQDGKRRVLVFSEAGGTGFSYHASRRAKNQTRRIHYVIQAGWRADNAIQGFGRSHRSDQAVAPTYVLPSTDIRGHQRFIATIARRLGELGALTGGERKSAGGDLFSETNNLENQYAEDAVTQLFRELHGKRVPGFNFDDLSKKLGYTKTIRDERTGEMKVINTLIDGKTGGLALTKIPSIQQFLNRILSLEVGEQNGLFDHFTQRMADRIAAAKEDGSYDPGTQTLKALSIRKLTDEVVYQHPSSTAKTRLVDVEYDRPTELWNWSDVQQLRAEKAYALNIKSGNIYALMEGPNRTLESGAVVPTLRRIGPTGTSIIPKSEVRLGDNYQEFEPTAAKAVWDSAVAKAPKTKSYRDTYVVGAFLPIWDRLKIPDPKIWRITTDDKQTFLGAHVPAQAVGELRARLGAGAGAAMSPETVFRAVLERGQSFDLANGWKVKRVRVGGDKRIEVIGPNYDEGREFQNYMGGYMERIAYQPRFFVPTDEAKGIETVRKLLEKSPIVQGGTEAFGGARPSARVSTPPRAAQSPAPSVAPFRAYLASQTAGPRMVLAPQTLGGDARYVANALRHFMGQNALAMARAQEALKQWHAEFDKTPVSPYWHYDASQPLPHNYAVIDALERDPALLPQRYQDLADVLDDEFGKLVGLIHVYNPHVLQNLMEHYFPHVWTDPKRAQNIMAQIATRLFAGRKEFLKKRSIPFFAEGLAAGLKPISDNPVDMVLAKMQSMQRFLLALRATHEFRRSGAMRFKYLFEGMPDGWTTVDDPSFVVQRLPVVTIREAFDSFRRAKLGEVLRAMGVSYKRVARLGGARWAEADMGAREIRARVGASEDMLWHELGHQAQWHFPELVQAMDTRGNSPTAEQLRKLADLQLEGRQASAGQKRNVRRDSEKIAEVFRAYVHAPELFEKTAPMVNAVFRKWLDTQPGIRDPLNEMRKGRMAVGAEETDVRLGGMQVLGHWIMPNEAAQVVKNYLSPSLSRYGLYRGFRAASNVLNGAQLGLSGFHLGFTSLDAMTSRLAVGIEDAVRGDLVRAAKTVATVPVSAVTNLLQGRKMVREALHPGSTDAETAGLIKALEQAGGRIGQDAFWRTNFTRTMMRYLRFVRQSISAGQPVKATQAAGIAALNAPLALLEQTMRPLMEYIVPRQKLGVFADMARREIERVGPNATLDQTREAMRKAWDSVDNRMGQVVYDNYFYNRAMKDVLLLTFRAWGWQQGKYVEGLGAIADAAKAAGNAGRGRRPEFTHRMAYAMALPMMVGILGAIATYIMTGRRPHGRDYFQPPTGETDANGNPVRLNFPSYVKDVVAYGQQPVTSVGHSLNPMFGTMFDLLENKDFYNVEIRHPDDPLWKQGGEVAAFAAKQLEPFSISGAMNLRENAAPVQKQILPFFGITPVPVRQTMTPAQALASDLVAGGMGDEPRTQEQFDKSKIIREAVRSMKSGLGDGQQTFADAMATGKLNPEAMEGLIERMKYTPLQFQVFHLSPLDGMRVWRVANGDERATLQPMLASKVLNSKTLTVPEKQGYLDELSR